MTITVNEKTRDLFPPSIRRRARLKIGDRLEIQVNGGIVSFIPELPTADDEYSSGQRRTIDARLAKADEDIRDGRTYGPFHNVGEMIASMKSEISFTRTALDAVGDPPSVRKAFWKQMKLLDAERQAGRVDRPLGPTFPLSSCEGDFSAGRDQPHATSVAKNSV